MWKRTLLAVVSGLVLVAPARAQTRAAATATVSIQVDALGTNVRHRPSEFRGLAGSMRSIAGRSTFEDRAWLLDAARRIEAHAARLDRALTTPGRTLATIGTDLDRLDGDGTALLRALGEESAGRPSEPVVRRALSATLPGPVS